jgi:predicted ATP-grasp superfamily ATP-dependent carboligase
MSREQTTRTVETVTDDPSPSVRLSVQDRATSPSSSHIDVLMLDAHNRQAVSCARVYGRRGLGVGLVGCEQDAAAPVPAFASQWCSVRAIVPDFSTHADAFVDALMALIDRYHPRMVLPGHDGSIEAVRSRRAELERVTALPLATERALEVAVSKERTLSLARSLGIAVPRDRHVVDMEDAADAIADIGLPAVIKPFRSWVNNGGTGAHLTSEPVTTVEGAHRALERVLSRGSHALLQERLPGRRDAVSIFYAQDRVWARFAQTSYREFPALGGVSVLCESLPLLDDIVQPAEALVREIGLEGCSMVEFRRDAQGRPVLMEINPRIGGSVALAVRSGVNFPNMLYDWATGQPLTEVKTYRTGRRLRWLAGDIWNLKATFNYQGLPDVPRGGQAVATFFLDFIRRPSALDPIHVRDMRPAFVELHRTLVMPYQEKLKRMRSKRRAARAARAQHAGKVVTTR